jgi:uncharacterized membrane protein
LHPFDIRAALLAKHAQHVVLIHFPIALFLAGVAFDFLAHWKKQRLLAATAYYNFFAAALMTIPVLITGLLAWQWQLDGQRLKGILLMHLVAGSVSSALIWIVWLICRTAQRTQSENLRGFRLVLEAIAGALVALTGHLGGFLSGVNGPG